MAYVSDMCDVNLHFFGSDKADGRRSFAREAVTQWAAASDLVFDFGWPQENLLVESSDQWALDLVAYDRPRREGGRRTLLAMEAKSHRRELEGLIDGGIVKSCGTESRDHAASSRSPRSTNRPFTNFAPARTSATSSGALTLLHLPS